MTRSRDGERHTMSARGEGRPPDELSVFPTALGWFALVGRRKRVVALRPGLPSRHAAIAQANRSFGAALRLSDWNPELRRRLTAYARGVPVVFHDVPLALECRGPFHRAALAACRAIRYGETHTYTQLAAAAGRPRAVRAAGTAMAQNLVPIIIPCHRVVRSDGGLGGYSAPAGVVLKRRLLEMERAGR
jgi:methylated-DNA-[protein]-cysteine S-methyltransferase